MSRDRRAETREVLADLEYPDRDRFDLPTSPATFPDGANYRIEVPTMNTVTGLEALLETAERHDIRINRVDMTFGIFRLTDQELEEYLALCKDHQVEALMGVGPRAYFDTGAQVLGDTIWAHVVGYRLRGMEQIVRAVEDVHRAVEHGCRGIMVYDEGLLLLLDEMRERGDLPEDLVLKGSAVMGYCNPLGCKLLEDLGADTINPQRDLELPMIAALREAVDVPLDIHADNPPASGQFVRTYEAPEMVRIAAPLYVKTGNVRLPRHGYRRMGAREGTEMGRQAAITVEFIEKYYPDARQSTNDAPDLAIPR